MTIRPHCSLYRLAPYTAALPGVEALVEDRSAFRLCEARSAHRTGVPD
jgi:hypothetical protein